MVSGGGRTKEHAQTSQKPPESHASPSLNKAARSETSLKRCWLGARAQLDVDPKPDGVEVGAGVGLHLKDS